jgi:hypothetical protein
MLKLFDLPNFLRDLLRTPMFMMSFLRTVGTLIDIVLGMASKLLSGVTKPSFRTDVDVLLLVPFPSN